MNIGMQKFYILISGCPLGQESQESQEKSGISENLAKSQEKVRKNGHKFMWSGKVRKNPG